jgi:hypothetical protein
MKLLSTIFLLIAFAPGRINAQKNNFVIVLNDTVSLTGTIEKFDKSKHHFDTCYIQQYLKSICLIDGNPWFGSVRALALPVNQLTKLTLIIKGIKTPLDVSGMFNPIFNNNLTKDHFKLENSGFGYLFNGWFFDGGGYYEAVWKIIKNKSIRVSISEAKGDFWSVEND